MSDGRIDTLRAAIAALEAQRATLGDSVLELALAPLRAQLAQAQRPTGLQRRQVTVLFADVVQSTALAQTLGAEDTLELLSDALRRMADVIEAHQGRVLRFTGDGIKAAFGMDVAREDDAERAVRAGLAVLQAGRAQAEVVRLRHGLADFAVRVGVHTGEVVLGAGVEADNTAMGAAVHIAARMEQSAPPGALRISHDTWSQVRGLFALEPQPPLAVKGVAEPMQTYLVHHALERSAASVERGLQGLRTPMVGRADALQRLLHTAARARETRQLQALTLLGDAGLGKSRLLREFTLHLGDARVLTLRSQPDGALRLFGLLRALLAAQCGLADTDSAEVARRKVVDGLGPWFGPQAAHAERQAQLIGQLAGLDFADNPTVKGLDPRGLRDQAFAALRAYLQALAAEGALPVLLVEDLHWADDGSLDLLQHLLAHAAELPVALVMSARPALLARRPGWATPEATLQLHPLDAQDGDALALALLQRVHPLPARLTALIVGQAEGNPYYMEELVRRLLDDGVIDASGPQWTVHQDRLDTLRLPTTLVGLLQARLDALPAAERQAARQASVIGHVFWDDALQSLDAQAPQALPGLQRAAFVKARDRSDFDGTTERQFDHHLLHQVTYDTLLKAERTLGHGAAARWLQARTQGRGAEFLAMTGEHAERAGDTALAIDCFEQAGKEAQRRFANAAAAAWLRRALGMLGDSAPARRLGLLGHLEVLADTVGDRDSQEATHAQMAALLERHPDEQGQALLCWCRALLADRRSDSATAQGHCEQASMLAERSGAAHTAARARGLLGWLHLSRGDSTGAQRHIETGLQWAGRIDDADLRAVAEAQLLVISAMNAAELCRFDEARTALLAVLSRAQAAGSPRLQASALDNLASGARRQGRWDEVLQWAEPARALGQACGATRDVARAQWRIGEAHWAMGEAGVAGRWFAQALDHFRGMADRHMELVSLHALGSLRLEDGDAQAALQWALQALPLQDALFDQVQALSITALSAQCHAQLGHADAARAAADAVLQRLQADLADSPAHATIELRWACHRILAGLGDERAGPLLAQLHGDVQARAVVLTPATDRERLIQAIPTYREIAAAWAAATAAGPA